MTPTAGRERCSRLLALGDSITAGVGDTVGTDAVHGPGWAAHLAAVLGMGSFTNLATNGARSSDVAEKQLDVALALRPRVATVLVGGNDVLRSDFDARLTLADLHRCVSELCRGGTDVVLVRLPVIGLFELSPRLVRHVMRRRVASINAAVDEVAEAVAGGGAGAPGPRSRSAGGTEPRSRSVGCSEIGQSMDRSQSKGPKSEQGPGKGPKSAQGRVVVVDATEAIAPAGAKAWHIDRVHPSPAGHRRLALAVAVALADLDPEYAPPGFPTAMPPATPDPDPSPTPARVPTDENGTVSPASALADTTRLSAALGQGPPREWVKVFAARLPDAPEPPSAWQRLVWLLRAGLPWCVRRGRDFLPGLLRAVVHDLRAERAFTPGGMVTSLADSSLAPRRRIGRG